MVDDHDESVGQVPEIDPYVPFSPFSMWLQYAPDPRTMDRFLSELNELREAFSYEEFMDAVKVATRWAAVDTGAIEGLYPVDRGFTFSIAASSFTWETISRIRGGKVASSIEDAMRAYDFVLDVATSSRPITEQWIRELHAIVVNSQDTFTVITEIGEQEQTLPKGMYKRMPNNPLNFGSGRIHGYASPFDTAPEMGRLVAELSSPEFLKADPVLQAAFAHYAFVSIHPFSDGNGRVSRALASVFLYRRPGVPLVIFADQKPRYIDSLESADDGVFAPFISFISERVIDTLSMIRSQLGSSRLPDVSEQMRAFSSILTGAEGISHSEMDAVSLRLIDLAVDSIVQVLASQPLASPMSAEYMRIASGAVAGVPVGYRVPPTAQTINFVMRSAAPATGEEYRQYSVAIRRPGRDGPDFILYSNVRILVGAYLRDLSPVISDSLEFRAELEIDREYREMFSGVAHQAENSLRNAGYLD